MKQFRIIIISLFSVLLISSCNTDFELSAPYDEIPVIFGLMDQSEDTVYVKINKSFIGDGDNTVYAGINDSSLYSNVVARIDEYIAGSMTRSFNLEEIWVNDLEEGIFYTDSQKLYFFSPNPPLSEDAIYKLSVDVAEEAESITSETDMIKGSDLKFGFLFEVGAVQFGMQWANASSLSNEKYLSETPSWQSVENGKRYELKMRLHYTEVTATSSTEKYIEWNLGSQEVASLNGGKTLSKEIDGESFFQTIDNKLTNYAFEADVQKRVMGDVEFFITAGNDNLNTFMEVNEPATGVVTERPTFTNIEGGVGIFASRFSTKIVTFLDAHTSNALAIGPYTSQYKFCVDPGYTYNGNDVGNEILTTYPNIECAP